MLQLRGIGSLARLDCCVNPSPAVLGNEYILLIGEPVRSSPLNGSWARPPHIRCWERASVRGIRGQSHVPRGWNGPALPESGGRAKFRGGSTRWRTRGPFQRSRTDWFAQARCPLFRGPPLGRADAPYQEVRGGPEVTNPRQLDAAKAWLAAKIRELESAPKPWPQEQVHADAASGGSHSLCGRLFNPDEIV
mgnify:CR=1 FL=1